MKKLIILLVFAVFFQLYIPAAAAENKPAAGADNQIPESLALSIHQNCSGHPSFLDYLVRDDGLLVVYSRRSETKNPEKGVFSTSYIDIFDTNGEFQAEISFVTRDGITLHFSGNALEIYLSSSMLSVDLSTYDVTYAQTPSYYAMENGFHTAFIKKEKEVGEWRYICKGLSMDYTSLVRTNGETEEVLLTLSGDILGTGQSWQSFAAPVIIRTAIIVGIGLFLKRKYKKE